MEEIKESKCALRHGAADREPPRKKDSQIKSSEETQYFFSASIAAGSCNFVANRSKVFVPCLGEAGDKLLRGAPSDGHTGMDDVSPGMHPRPLSRVLFKADPLGQDDTKGVVDPSHFMSRLAIGDDVIYNGFDGLQDLNLQAASGFPRPAFAPAHSAINVCKFIPTPPNWIISGISARDIQDSLFIHCFFNDVKDIIRAKGSERGSRMPRKADARLESRILDAAYRLWSDRGEHALTMRAVARASGTTTPTLYERIPNKGDLISLLRRRARRNLFSAIRPSRTPAQACQRALDFFTAYPNDFRLISEDWAIAFARKEQMPSFEFLQRRLAAQLGGKPDQHTPLALALVALLHGTATLLHSVDTHKKISRDFRLACIAACEALIHAAGKRRSINMPSRRTRAASR